MPQYQTKHTLDEKLTTVQLCGGGLVLLFETVLNHVDDMALPKSKVCRLIRLVTQSSNLFPVETHQEMLWLIEYNRI